MDEALLDFAFAQTAYSEWADWMIATIHVDMSFYTLVDDGRGILFDF